MNSQSSQRTSMPWLWLLAIGLFAVGAWYVLNRPSAKPTASNSLTEGTKDQPTPPKVVVGIPLKMKIVVWDEFVARLEAIDSVDVRARVSGYLASTHFKEGQDVTAGELLAVIDRRPFVAEMKRIDGDLSEAQGKRAQAEAAVVQAKAEADRAAAHRDLTRKQLERNQSLRRQNAISQEDFDVAEAASFEAVADVSVAQSKIESANANLVAAKAAEEVAQANLEIARLNLTFTEIRAPISGRISRRFVTEGNMISGGSSESTLLTNIVSLDPIHCYFDADEKTYLKYMQLNREGKRPSSREVRNPVYVALANDKNAFPYEGHMDFVDNRVDRQTGTIRGRAILPNEERNLTPGMFARLLLPGSPPQETLLIPDKAVGTDQTEKFVFVVNEKNEVEKRFVQIGPISHGLRVVQSGLDGSERVITSGMQRAKEKELVSFDELEAIVASKSSYPEKYEPFEKDLTPPRRTAANVRMPDGTELPTPLKNIPPVGVATPLPEDSTSTNSGQ